MWRIFDEVKWTERMCRVGMVKRTRVAVERVTRGRRRGRRESGEGGTRIRTGVSGSEKGFDGANDVVYVGAVSEGYSTGDRKGEEGLGRVEDEVLQKESSSTCALQPSISPASLLQFLRVPFLPRAVDNPLYLLYFSSTAHSHVQSLAFAPYSTRTRPSSGGRLTFLLRTHL